MLLRASAIIIDAGMLPKQETKAHNKKMVTESIAFSNKPITKPPTLNVSQVKSQKRAAVPVEVYFSIK